MMIMMMIMTTKRKKVTRKEAEDVRGWSPRDSSRRLITYSGSKSMDVILHFFVPFHRRLSVKSKPFTNVIFVNPVFCESHLARMSTAHHLDNSRDTIEREAHTQRISHKTNHSSVAEDRLQEAIVNAVDAHSTVLMPVIATLFQDEL
jgi:hypothetical protein